MGGRRFATGVRCPGAIPLRADIDAIAPPAAHAQYFPSDLFSLSAEEVFIDCGAYDGDTIQSFIDRRKESFAAIYALEPDPSNFRKLQSRIAAMPPEISAKIRKCQCAVGAADGVVRFSDTGTPASAATSNGSREVECVSLDRLLEGAKPTYIKMDIEGAGSTPLPGPAA